MRKLFAFIIFFGATFAYFLCNAQKNYCERDSTGVLWNPEQPPYYPSGPEGLKKDLYTALAKILPASNDTVSGRVILKFKIDKEGEIDPASIKALRNKNLPPEHVVAATEAVKTLGRFEPGKMNGVPLNVYYNLPVIFPIPPQSAIGEVNCEKLRDELYDIVDSAPGMVGIAFVSDNDTITINNGVRYPMMSVFKLHESLAVADEMQKRGASLDSIISVSRSEIDPDTWSPMLKQVGEGDFDISVAELIRYAIVSSDNNASNILFERIVSPKATDRFIRSIAPDTTFSNSYSEKEMKANHELAYRNYSSPLAAALLIKKVFTDTILNPESTEVIQQALLTATTGQDRIGLPLAKIHGVKFAHKTGSGYRNAAGELAAFNDVAYVELPDGRSYSLAVMIRDFAGSEEEAAAIMARISSSILRHLQPAM